MGFVFVAIIFSFVATLLLLDRFRSYEANLDMLVLSKSDQGAIEAPAVRDTLMLLGSQNDFLYTMNETADVSGVEFSLTGETSFRIRTVSDSPLDARDGAIAASQAFFALIGKYYDIRNDIDIRSIGIPETKAIVSHPILLIGAGMLSGIIVSIAFFIGILSFARLVFSARGKEREVSSITVFPAGGEERTSHEEMSPVFSPDMFVPKKQESHFFSFEPSVSAREKDYAHFNRGPAPANLPIAMDDAEVLPDFLFPTSATEIGDGIVSEETMTPSEELIVPQDMDTPMEEALPMDREPTEEEYKRRLNELLQGKMPK